MLIRRFAKAGFWVQVPVTPPSLLGSSIGLGHQPFTLVRWVRFPYRVPQFSRVAQRKSNRLISDRSTFRNCPWLPDFKNNGVVGKLVTPVDCKSAALVHCWFNSSRLHQVLKPEVRRGCVLPVPERTESTNQPTCAPVSSLLNNGLLVLAGKHGVGYNPS